jgi:NodT family efflux transporter outer membrane factor (OMF) lipoprotein
MRLLQILAILVWIPGCVGAPAYDPPVLPFETPDAWSDSSSAISGEWWTEFKDDTLNALIEEAVANNYSLDAAAARIEQSIAMARIAGADLLPNAGVSLNASRQKQIFVGLPIGGSGVPSSTSDSFRLDFQASWELDLWGRVRAGHAAAEADLQASLADYAGAHLSLTGQVIRAYVGAIEARQQKALLDQTLESFEALETRVRDRYEKGLRPSLDLRLTQASVASAKDSQLQREQGMIHAARQLELLLGRYPAALVETTDALPALPSAAPAGLPADLIARRPDMAAAERRLAAANSRVYEAQTSLLPAISLTGSVGSTSDEIGDLLDSDFQIWSLAAGLIQPIFQNGRLRANIDLTKGREQEQTALYVEQALRAFEEVERALTAERILRDRGIALNVAAEQNRKALTISEDRYVRGLDDILTVLEARRRFFTAQSQLLAVQRLQIENRVNLILALGGGFQVEGDSPDEQPVNGE